MKNKKLKHKPVQYFKSILHGWEAPHKASLAYLNQGR